MTRLEIIGGPSKLNLMLSLFDTDMGQRTVIFRTAHNLDNAVVRVNSARRRNPEATSWDIEGTVNFLSGRKGKWIQVAICYYSDTRTGLMTIFNDGSEANIVQETPEDAKRAKALMLIIEKMVTMVNFYGGRMPEKFYSLFEKAKSVSRAEDRNLLEKAISEINE